MTHIQDKHIPLNTHTYMNVIDSYTNRSHDIPIFQLFSFNITIKCYHNKNTGNTLLIILREVLMLQHYGSCYHIFFFMFYRVDLYKLVKYVHLILCNTSPISFHTLFVWVLYFTSFFVSITCFHYQNTGV